MIHTGYYRRRLRIQFYMIVYRLFYSCTVKGYNTGPKQWCDWRGYKGANLPHDKINAKTESPFCLYFGMHYTLLVCYTFLVFSKLLLFAFFGSFWTVVFRWFRVLVGLCRNQHPDTLSFLKFFWMLARGPQRLLVGPFQLRFPGWPKVLAMQLVYSFFFTE